MDNYFSKFWKKRSLIVNPDISSHYKKDEAIKYDYKFVKKRLKKHHTVLDLGCGPMRLVSKISKHCKHIDCVDFQKKYVSTHKKYNNTKGYVSNVQDFIIKKKYDLIIIFGVFTFFNKRQIYKTIKNIEKMTHIKSKILIKDQCGVKRDVFIDKHSDVVGSRYKAFYHYYKSSNKIFSKKFKTRIFTKLYPKRLNKFKNTKTVFFELKKN